MTSLDERINQIHIAQASAEQTSVESVEQLELIQDSPESDGMIVNSLGPSSDSGAIADIVTLPRLPTLPFTTRASVIDSRRLSCTLGGLAQNVLQTPSPTLIDGEPERLQAIDAALQNISRQSKLDNEAKNEAKHMTGRL